MKAMRNILLACCFIIGMWAYILLPDQDSLIQVGARNQVFTQEDLAQFDGTNGNKAYYAFKGVVYDGTGTVLWEQGEYLGIKAGTDLTAQITTANAEQLFINLPIVGSYQTTGN